MKLLTLPRPLWTALCGFTFAALLSVSFAQNRPREDRPRDERPAEGQRPPLGQFRAGETPRGEGRPPEGRRDEARPGEAPRGETRPGEGQRGMAMGQFNPQEMFRDLNEDQRTALRSYFEATQAVQRETGERSMRLRREIAESATAEKPDEGLIRDKIMEAAKLEAETTIARVRAFAQVRNKLPKETVERLRSMITNSGPRPGFQGPGGPGGSGGSGRPGGEGGAGGAGGEGRGEFRRPGGENFNPSGQRPPDGEFRRPSTPREGEPNRRPVDGDRGPRVDGDRGPRPDGDRGPRPDGDRGPRPDGERGRSPQGNDRRPELPQRPPADR